MSKLNNELLLRQHASVAHTLADILDSFGLSRTDGNYVRLRKYLILHNIDVTHLTGKNTPSRWKYDVVSAAVRDATSFTDCLRKMGLTVHGDNAKTLRRYVTSYKIDTSHFSSVTPVKTTTLSDAELFCENSAADRGVVKKHIIKRGLIPYVCRDCGNNGAWNGKPISLHLEHINGTNNDNRLKNLTFLCPNCHSQTPTFAGKNSKLSND